MSFFAELKRRRVHRVAGAYLVIAWVAIEVSETLAPRLTLPDWTTTFVIFLAAIGLPAVLVFSWIFDVGTDGIQRTAPASATTSNARYVALVIVVAVAALGAYAGWQRYGKHAGGGTLTSIAVLPFANMSGDPAQEPFADGISEEILNALAQVEGLSVAARTSAFAFKNKNEDVTDIGRKLRVAAVLEGSVRKSGNRLRITAQLIKASDGYHLWSQQYDREAHDVFAVQDEIARTIVAKLKIALAGGQGPKVARGGTTNVTAHELYLLGLHHFAKRRPEDMRRAIEVFEQAIAEDSSYALAHAGLAVTYAAAPFYLEITPHEAARRGRAAALTALAIDSTVAEAYAALGDMLFHVDYDLAGSERMLRRALALKPSYFQALNWLLEPLYATGRLDEALRVARRAVELDPVSLRARSSYAYTLTQAGRLDEALVQIDSALLLDPTHPGPLRDLVQVNLALGNTAGLVAALRRYAPVGGSDREAIELTARALLDPSVKPAALRAIAAAAATPLPRANLLELYLALGDHARALDHIEHMYAARDVSLPFVFWDINSKPLRSEPRFRALAAKLAITPPSSN